MWRGCPAHSLQLSHGRGLAAHQGGLGLSEDPQSCTFHPEMHHRAGPWSQLAGFGGGLYLHSRFVLISGCGLVGSVPSGSRHLFCFGSKMCLPAPVSSVEGLVPNAAIFRGGTYF